MAFNPFVEFYGLYTFCTYNLAFLPIILAKSLNEIRKNKHVFFLAEHKLTGQKNICFCLSYLGAQFQSLRAEWALSQPLVS
jgi:hypothetical protein